MGLRVKRYGPLSTMVVVGRLVGTFEPALVIVTMAQATSASARTNTIAPSEPAGRSTGRNGKGPFRPFPSIGYRVYVFAPTGRRTVNTEPVPGWLVTVTSPPIMRASLRVMARPSPVPP